MKNILASPYWRIVWIVALFYIFMVSILYFGQRNLMYFPSQEALGSPGASQLPEMQTVLVKTEDGLNLVAWFAPPKKRNGKVIVLFHGNANSIAARAFKARYFLDAGYGVYLCEYRGFAPNAGNPSEQGFYSDARAAVSFLKVQGYAPAQLVFYGESIGTGVAVEMAKEYPPAALILEAAYTSTLDVAKMRYFYVPVSLLMKDRFDSLSKIGDIHAPLLALHGDADNVVPYRFGRQLFASANAPKTFLSFPGGGHVDLYDRGAGPMIVAWLDKQFKGGKK